MTVGATIKYDDVEVGTQLPEQEFTVLRVNLLMYCGACTDYTATHWNERIAKSVGLPNVIAHGTFNIAQAVRVVTDWAGDPAALIEYRTRFARPLVVPDDDRGAMLRVSGVVKEKLADNRVMVRLTARSSDGEVLSGARALVRLG